MSRFGLGNVLMWLEAIKHSHQTSQIKAVIVTLTITGANERQISYRNKHIGDTDDATLQWECGHRQWVTLPPLGRTSAGRNLGMVQGACCSLVLKTKLGPVIHKSLVYQCLQTLQCTFHESRGTSRSPDMKHSSQGSKITSSADPEEVERQTSLLSDDRN